MKRYDNPAREDWEGILARPRFRAEEIAGRVKEILDAVREEGDRAVLRLTREIDGAELTADGLEVPEADFEAAAAAVPEELKQALHAAKENIALFHARQNRPDVEVETVPGVVCRQRAVPIRRVGLYVPGGTAPLFSTVLMLALPARIAGCGEVVLCTPPDREGRVSPVILYAARLCGVDRVFRIGGAMAIGALAYGTDTVPRVDKIFGPGNRYVTAAKQMVSLYDVAIDMPAGPSEVLVLADESADPAFVAADLLSQLEHGRDSQAVLVTASRRLADEVQRELSRQLEKLDRREMAGSSARNSTIVVLDRPEEAMELVNLYAPEHLILSVTDPEAAAELIVNAGSVFLGHYTPESAGDYASGTNHTLPTGGWARSYSGVNLDSFRKKITYQRITPEGLKLLGGTIETLAAAEGLTAHRNAVAVRLDRLK